jgi:Holliday junction resolvase RusA-like endonuclease
MRSEENSTALYPGLRIVLTMPPNELHPNSRVHFIVKAKHTKAYRQIAAMCARQAITLHGWRTVTQATVRAVFFFNTKQRRDKSNLNACLKAAEDGLQDAGVIVNDSGFTWMPPDVYCSKEHPRVELYVTAATAAGG